VSWVGGAESFGARVGPIAQHSQRDEIATDCRIDLMSDHWPLLVAEPLDGERLVNSQLRPRAGAVAIGRHDYSAALGPQELVHFLARVDYWCVYRQPAQLVAGRRVQRPASNSMGRVVGPVIPSSGFQGAGPLRCGLGMRRVMTVRASASSSRARCVPRQ